MTTETMQAPSASWRSMRLKYAAPLRSERTAAGADHTDYLGLENIEPWTGRIIESETASNEQSTGEEPGLASVFRHGDVLFGKLRPYLAKACYASRDGVCSTELLVLCPKPEVHPRFLLYSVLTPDFMGSVDASTFGAKMPRANWDFIGSMGLRFPSLDLQLIIADYLDRETARIDGLIDEKKRMLALLEEKRTALISRVVTRGLDLDASMKPSGQEWLGEIPAHWRMIPIKHIATVGNGSTPMVDNPDYWDDDGYPWLNSSVVNSMYVYDPSRRVSSKALKECHLPLISPPAVLIGITGQGKTRGMVSVLKIEATINQHLAFIKPFNENLTAEYLRHLLSHAYGFLRNASDGSGSTKGAITCEQLANFKIPLPPHSEQSNICALIESGLTSSDLLIKGIRRSVELLGQRRAALITAAVTGRIPLEEMAG